jgi:hypothetical protein
MILQIAKLYKYNYTDGVIIFTIAALLILSIRLSIILAPFTETLLFFLKPLIAGAIIWGMGEGTIAILEWDSKRRN